jgi:hypothetical protein
MKHTTLLPIAQVYYGNHKAESSADVETTDNQNKNKP